MKHLLFIFIGTICFYTAHSQTTYYIAEDGDDSRSGQSRGQAFATITHAANSAKHGDTILVLAGTYTNETYGTLDVWKEEITALIANKTTDTEDYLVIKPIRANSVTLMGDGRFIFQIRNSNNIWVEGFTITGELKRIPLSFAKEYQFTYKDSLGAEQERIPSDWTKAEIEARTDLPDIDSANITRPPYFNTSGISINACHHIEIVNNTVSNMPGEGIRSFSSDFLTITDNTVFACSRRSSTGVHGLSVYKLNSEIDSKNANDEGVRVLIARNKVYGNFNKVFSWSELKTFVNPHFDEGKGITVQRSVPAMGWKKGIVRIENNIAYENGFSGIQINSGSRIEIVNNTCYENNMGTTSTADSDQHGISIQDANEILIANNIIQADSNLNNGLALKVSPNSGLTGAVVITKNIILGKVNNNAIDYIQRPVNRLPKFEDVENFDFSLSANSKAIDNADPNYSPATDFFQNPRDEAPDLGAIEFMNNTTSTNAMVPPPFKLYPNPTTHTLTVEGISFKRKEVTLYNAIGQDMTNYLKIRGNQIMLHALPAGIYFLTIQSLTKQIYKQ